MFYFNLYQVANSFVLTSEDFGQEEGGRILRVDMTNRKLTKAYRSLHTLDYLKKCSYVKMDQLLIKF